MKAFGGGTEPWLPVLSFQPGGGRLASVPKAARRARARDERRESEALARARSPQAPQGRDRRERSEGHRRVGRFEGGCGAVRWVGLERAGLSGC